MKQLDAARARPTPRALPHLHTHHLYVLIVLGGFGIFLALVPTPPNDFWWHLKAGELVARQGIPTTNLFAWTLPPDAPYIYATWLGEWLFYAITQAGGLGAAALARNLLGLAAFALVAVEARRRSGSWRLAALATLLAAAMSINNLIIRTQNWAWVPFALTMLILGGYTAGTFGPRALLALPPLMAFWVNVHGGFVTGLALVGITAAGETLRALLRRRGATPPRRLLWLYLALAGTLAATLLNPLGVGIFGYVLKLLTDPPSQGLIIEWQSPAPTSIAGVAFYGAILALMAALAYGRRRPTLTEFLLLAAFLWLAWSGVRYVVWFGMVAMPILAQCLADPAAPPARRAAGSAALNWLLAGALLLLLVLAQPPFKRSLPLPDEYTGGFAEVPGAPLVFTATTPVAAAEYLRANPGGRLFNEMGYGSYLIWALGPETQVFIDPRVELFPLALWEDYLALTRGYEVERLLDKHGVTRALVDLDLQPKLAAALASSPRWEREYDDGQSVIYRRR